MNGELPSIDDFNDIEGNLIKLVNKCREFPDIDILEIQKAYRYSVKSHEKDIRKNKEPYYTHPLLATLYYLYIFDYPDTSSVVACLLHDTAEHSGDPVEKLNDIEKKFGLEVRKLVNGLTNIRGTKTDEALSFSKLMLEMIKDYRVMLIKLCDRLHNMITLEGIKDESRRKLIAEETLKFFVPAARWIGVWRMKQHLEEMAFAHLDPENYRAIKANLSKKFLEFSHLIKELDHKVKQVMNYYKIDCTTTVTHKSSYELYQLMEKGAKSIDEIDNFYSYVISLNNNDVPHCYYVLGILYKYFTPFETKDYIAFPKFNQFQSLLTYLYNEERKKIEVLIRTIEMDDIATKGIMSLYRKGHYSSLDMSESDIDNLQEWMTRLIKGQGEDATVKIWQLINDNYHSEEIYVFLGGEQFRLPKRASILDLAFLKDKEKALCYDFAKVNGNITGYFYNPQNKDEIEIFYSDFPKANKEWENSIVLFKSITILNKYLDFKKSL